MYVYVIERADRYRGHDYWSAYVVYKSAKEAVERVRMMINFDNKDLDLPNFLSTDLRHIATFDEDTNYVKAYGEIYGHDGEARYKYRIEEVELR